ncbi:hypothetical protein HT136_20665 [Novosphingobium profundi]|uniref:HipA family kinase n=1 Tax=Novosphingobium profundi TaxID=1774954 RepID=UPI001BD96209|nr:HipA family kinase [Novosphingobium profundi]MBT0670783.1 hypothetical protein [Novosphingobium profundi]
MDQGNPGVGIATLLAGATPFTAGNVNETYRAQIRLPDESTAMAIVKDLDLRQLANELLASTMARAVGLPTPNVYLTLARPDVISLNKAPRLEDGNRIMFASSDVKVPSVVFQYQQDRGAMGSLLASIISWEGLGRCYGYDTWIANIDRHAGNLLFGNPKEVWLIDHGHTFTGPVWESADLKAEYGYRHRLSEWLTPSMDEPDRKMRAGEAASLESVIPKLDIDRLIRSSMVDQLLPSDEIAALRDFLRDRCSYVAYYTNRALGVPSFI